MEPIINLPESRTFSDKETNEATHSELEKTVSGGDAYFSLDVDQNGKIDSKHTTNIYMDAETSHTHKDRPDDTVITIDSNGHKIVAKSTAKGSVVKVDGNLADLALDDGHGHTVGEDLAKILENLRISAHDSHSDKASSNMLGNLSMQDLGELTSNITTALIKGSTQTR